MDHRNKLRCCPTEQPRDSRHPVATFCSQSDQMALRSGDAELIARRSTRYAAHRRFVGLRLDTAAWLRIPMVEKVMLYGVG